MRLQEVVNAAGGRRVRAQTIHRLLGYKPLAVLRAEEEQKKDKASRTVKQKNGKLHGPVPDGTERDEDEDSSDDDDDEGLYDYYSARGVYSTGSDLSTNMSQDKAWGFKYFSGRTLPAGWVLVDETSMLEVPLAGKLLSALR